MHSDDVRTFVTVVEAGSISAAARELHLTQPAVSRRIQRLEDAVGAPLIDRRTRPMSLTEAGRAAIDRCRRLVFAAEELRSLAHEGVVPLREVRIGVAHALTELVMTEPVDHVRRKYPGASVRLHTGWSEELLERLKNATLDAAVILLFDRQRPSAGLVGEMLAHEELAIIAPRAYPGRRQQLRDLQGADWILNPEGCAGRRELRRAFAQLHIPLRVSVEAYSYELQLRLVARGRGLGLVPSRLLSRSPSRGKLRVLHVNNVKFSMGIWMVTAEYSGPAQLILRAFQDAFVRVLSNGRMPHVAPKSSATSHPRSR